MEVEHDTLETVEFFGFGSVGIFASRQIIGVSKVGWGTSVELDANRGCGVVVITVRVVDSRIFVIEVVGVSSPAAVVLLAVVVEADGASVDSFSSSL